MDTIITLYLLTKSKKQESLAWLHETSPARDNSFATLSLPPSFTSLILVTDKELKTGCKYFARCKAESSRLLIFFTYIRLAPFGQGKYRFSMVVFSLKWMLTSVRSELLT